MTHNEEQYKAICHHEGPAMVLAGPGVGKTYVITNRIKTLIEEYGVSAHKILVVTFSKMAALEMQQRFDGMMDGKHLPVQFGTFHSIFFRILRAAYHYEGKDIVTPALKMRFLEEALRDTNYEVEDSKAFLEDIEREISKVKGNGIDIHCYYSIHCPEQIFRDLYQGYQQRLQRHRCLDFDDMLVYTYQLLNARNDILLRWQQQFQYILIDEFQDINQLQYENILMLAQPENNLFIVGDDDQSIYGFRGAKPDIMLSFPKQFPGAEQILLGVNYRCSSQILKAAGKLIRHNKKRYKKDLTAHTGKKEGVRIRRDKNLTTEADEIVRQLEGYRQKGIAYKDMAVLFRTNTQMRTVAGKLMEHGLPFIMKERVPNIFDTWLAGDVLCYVKIALGDYSRAKFLKICNRPLRYLSRAAFEKPEVSFAALRSYYISKKQLWMLERLEEFETQLFTLKNLSPYSALHYIRKGIGYDEFLTQYAKERNVDVQDWFEVLDEIQETAKEKESLAEWLSFVDNYGEMLNEMQREQQKMQREKDGINLLTMHGSKGLEFQVVFIPTVNEGVSPYSKSIQAGEVEEERRMLYVAMTRAKRHLHISFVKERFNKKMEPSRFLYEMAPELQKKAKDK